MMTLFFLGCAMFVSGVIVIWIELLDWLRSKF